MIPPRCHSLTARADLPPAFAAAAGHPISRGGESAGLVAGSDLGKWLGRSGRITRASCTRQETRSTASLNSFVFMRASYFFARTKSVRRCTF